MAKNRKHSASDPFTDNKVDNRRRQLLNLEYAVQLLRTSNMYCIDAQCDVSFEICKAINLIESQIKVICDELQIPYKAR